MYSIYGIEDKDNIQENLCYNISYFKEKQLRCESYFYCVFIIVQVNDQVMKPFNKSLL